MEKSSILRDLEKAERDERSTITKIECLQGEHIQALQESTAARREALFSSDVPVQRIQDMSRNQLIHLAQEQQNQLNRADLAGLIAQAKIQRGPALLHREAFMLMRYVSEGGTDVKLIWNSRDGVTPFEVHIDGMKYAHDIKSMLGPFFDRPEGCIAQWETRTELEMMLCCRRMLNRALLLGRITEEKAIKYQNDPDFARSWNLHIGLRSMATGRYTDDPGVA